MTTRHLVSLHDACYTPISTGSIEAKYYISTRGYLHAPHIIAENDSIATWYYHSIMITIIARATPQCHHPPARSPSAVPLSIPYTPQPVRSIHPSRNSGFGWVCWVCLFIWVAGVPCLAGVGGEPDNWTGHRERLPSTTLGAVPVHLSTYRHVLLVFAYPW